ncbi:MAG: hypothetical protein GX567_01480 [Clostridia bacterium]|nr:hypothetical protein [Clostridia bacterium]
MDMNTGNNFTQEDIQQNKAMAILSYLGILVLIPILAAKDSAYARYHANQGLVLVIASIALGVVSTVVSMLSIPFVGVLVYLCSIVIFIFEVMGIVQAAKGEAKPLPVIGGIQILK